MVLTTSQKRRNLDTNIVQLNTPNDIITKSKAGKLLGLMLHEDLKWNDHIIGQGDSLIKSLSMRVAALRLLPKVTSSTRIAARRTCTRLSKYGSNT